MIAQPFKVNSYPIMDLCLCKYLPWSESTYPSTPLLNTPKCRHIEDLRKLGKIHYTDFQCSFPESSIYILTMLTIKTKFGFLWIITYIKDLMALEYGTCVMYVISVAILGLKVDDSLKCAAKGVLIGFVSCILKHRRTFSIYFFLESCKNLHFLPLKIFVCKIFLAAPNRLFQNLLSNVLLTSEYHS